MTHWDVYGSHSTLALWKSVHRIPQPSGNPHSLGQGHKFQETELASHPNPKELPYALVYLFLVISEVGSPGSVNGPARPQLNSPVT